MTDMNTKVLQNRQPADMNLDYEAMRVNFTFGSTGKMLFSLPIKARGSDLYPVSVAVEEDDVKALCLEENHSLADFEAIRRRIKSFLRDHQTFVVNDIEYRVRREDVLCDIVKRVIKGERLPKVEAVPVSEVA